MSRLNRYFVRSEFACQCGCGFDAVDVELLEVLTAVREYFGAPVVINSGCRCVKHNRAVGGKSSSYHLRGQAADIVVSGADPRDVAGYVAHHNRERYGIGCYRGFSHVDVRRNRVYWTGD